MLKSYKEILIVSDKYKVPPSEILFMDINIEGISYNCNYERIRFSYKNDCSQQNTIFSVQNNPRSIYSIKNNCLKINDQIVGNVIDICEDDCKLLYPRNTNKVLCFNPNDRYGCIGCKFCYSPNSLYKHEIISSDNILSFFKTWLNKNKYNDLSHIEQIAIVTGCFKNEDASLSYLIQLRETLKELCFNGKIFFLGNILNKHNLELLKKIKPFNICFAIECFENRKEYLRKDKSISIEKIFESMKLSIECGFSTNFSYILGLDSTVVLQKIFNILLEYINTFPIISLYQTDDSRLKHRNNESWNIDYYLVNRKYFESLFLKTNLRPNSWNNFRSPWRLTFADEKI